MKKSLRKIHNPKSHAPAVYIPCWLIQVLQNELSHLAKILYGRLAQWSNTKGVVSRSASELASEMGCHIRVIERGLKELRDVGLIETYQISKGGVNSFIFLDHEFMYRPLQHCLDYYEQNSPVDKSASEGLPSDKNVGTPPTFLSVPPDKNVGLKYKEIKINKTKSFCASPDQKANSPVDNSKSPLSAAPLPSNNQARLEQKKENEVKHPFANRNNAVRSLVPEWGPGHPSWESLNGSNKSHAQ